MSLWAIAEIICSNPKKVNFKDIATESIKKHFGDLDETIITSTYSKEHGVKLGISTTHVGSLFNKLIDQLILDFNKQDVGYFYVEIERNYFV